MILNESISSELGVVMTPSRRDQRQLVELSWRLPGNLLAPSKK